MMDSKTDISRVSPDATPRFGTLETDLAAETCALAEATLAREATGEGTDWEATKLAASSEFTADSIWGDMVLPAAFGSSGLVAFCSVVAGTDKVL